MEEPMSWQIDNAHSEINFTVRHMMISNVRGSFERFTGSVNFNPDDPTQSSVEVQIAADSINTREAKRDGHLKSPDFFNAEKYPYLTFKSTRVDVVDATHARLTGNLTIGEVTRPVTLDVEYAGMSKSPWGTFSAGFTASTRISRKDWNLNWNVALETGGWLVGDEIKIDLEMEIVQVPEMEMIPA
jgi:polyisoprenoid-binding protein YceI